ncbi:MAG: hypothetical protein Q9162_001935 [Coniocarpon cinnabarinum]
MPGNSTCNANIPTEQCTLDTCCLDRGSVNYLPSVAGNGVYLLIFALILLFQLIFGIRYKTWGFLTGMGIGVFGEVVGYGGRIWMHYSIFKQNPFLVYLIPLTIAPAFLTAGIYLALGRVIKVYGDRFSLLPAGTYAVVFVGCDFISLLLQAAGGAITSIADPGSSTQDTGVNTMIGGLSFQVASLALFMLLAGYFFWNVRRNFTSRNGQFANLTGTRRFHYFEAALCLATLLIFIRCVFRVAELKEGFSGSIANSEPLFMVFEGPMVFLAVGLLTVFHPGVIFKGRWQEANFGVWKGRGKQIQTMNEPEWTELQEENQGLSPGLKANR